MTNNKFQPVHILVDPINEYLEETFDDDCENAPPAGSIIKIKKPLQDVCGEIIQPGICLVGEIITDNVYDIHPWHLVHLRKLTIEELTYIHQPKIKELLLKSQPDNYRSNKTWDCFTCSAPITCTTYLWLKVPEEMIGKIAKIDWRGVEEYQETNEQGEEK